MKEQEKIQAAAESIEASPSESGCYIYKDHETAEWYEIPEDELVVLYDLRHDPDTVVDAYSLWCARGICHTLDAEDETDAEYIIRYAAQANSKL